MIYHKDTGAHYCENIKLRDTPPNIMALFFGENEARHPPPRIEGDISKRFWNRGGGI